MRLAFIFTCLFPVCSLGFEVYEFPHRNPVRLNDLPVIQISQKETYDEGFCREHRQSLWVKYDITSNQVVAASTNSVSRTDDFRADGSVVGSATPADYTRSGFDRGHLCAAQDRAYDRHAMSETFLMSNMSPQDGPFNRGIWKELENYARNYARKHGYVTVITGPIILDRHFSIGRQKDVSVPQAYFKILVNTNEQMVAAYLIPNQGYEHVQLSAFRVPLGYVETLSDFVFIPDGSTDFDKWNVYQNKETNK